MSVLDRSELEQSHLSDLHAIASELGIEGFRKLSRAKLIDAILAGGGGGGDDDDGEAAPADEAKAADDDQPAEDDQPADDGGASGDDEPAGEGRGGRRRGRIRLRRGKAAEEGEEAQPDTAPGESHEVVIPEGDDGEPVAGAADEPESGHDDAPADGDGDGDDERSGVLDILPGGSGFMRADAFAHSRDDVYVSPAQIRRCELRAGDEISGPVRPPRRSERYPSLVRVASVNGQPPEAAEDRTGFEDLTPVFATEALETIHGLPFGKGSRVAIGGPPGAGATRLLREVADTFQGGLDVLVLLAGVRPEEVTDWKRAGGFSIAGGGFDRPADELAQIAEMAVERAKRIVERGGDAVLVVDGLDALSPAAARRVFGAARNTEEAGSLTIVASTGSSGELQRLATTRIVLTQEGALDAAASGTLRGELLGAG